MSEGRTWERAWGITGLLLALPVPAGAVIVSTLLGAPSEAGFGFVLGWLACWITGHLIQDYLLGKDVRARK